MQQSATFTDTFDHLKGILLPYTDGVKCIKNEPGVFYIDTLFIMKNKKPLFFASVQIRKNYVSYHLMPVYVFPQLLNQCPDPLLKRMQGKSCFNFKSVNPELFEQLKILTDSGYQEYQQAGYV